jgi:hypothetical protein
LSDLLFSWIRNLDFRVMNYKCSHD